MIYGPGRFCFIHIPRTGGNAITEALSRACIGQHDVLVATNGKLADAVPFYRHATARELKLAIPDWDSIYKFAIDRSIDAIRDSEQRLIDRDLRAGIHLSDTVNPEYLSLLRSVPSDRFLHQINDPWRHWCRGPDDEFLGVRPIPFNRLQEFWPMICKACGIPPVELHRLNSAP